MPTKTKAAAKPGNVKETSAASIAKKGRTARGATARTTTERGAPKRVQDPETKTPPVQPKNKVQRPDLDIEYFHELLLEERARLEEERELVRAASKDLEGSMPEDSEGGEEDTADLAAAIMDKEMDLSVEEELENQLSAIDHALVKIEEGTYGICDISGEPIPESRLKLLPWASLTVQCQAMAEGE